MVKIKEAIVVEGRYDKNTLSQIVDAPIFETKGFGIFKDKAQMALLRQVAERRGLIVFTDADGAGFVIRNYLKGAISPAYLKHGVSLSVAVSTSASKAQQVADDSSESEAAAPTDTMQSLF